MTSQIIILLTSSHKAFIKTITYVFFKPRKILCIYDDECDYSNLNMRLKGYGLVSIANPSHRTLSKVIEVTRVDLLGVRYASL